MSVAFVLGNGNSRKHVSLDKIRSMGPIYACNAIYRDFTPDVLIATDAPIAREIQQSGYALKNRFYTRRPIENLGAKSLFKKYKGFSSGPNAVGQACIDGYQTIYLIGFDLGSTNNQFNNVYADTDFYKKTTDSPTYSGNWITQICSIANDYPKKQFIRVEGAESCYVKNFGDLINMQSMPIDRFIKRLNTTKGLS